MVIDTSILFALSFSEPEREAFDLAIRKADQKLISTATLVECASVFAGRRPNVPAMFTLDGMIADLGLEAVPVDEAQWRIAAEALLRFGKGRHRARLNLGDSFAYALSMATGQPLLFKSEDFAQTDVVAAAYEFGGAASGP